MAQRKIKKEESVDPDIDSVIADLQRLHRPVQLGPPPDTNEISVVPTGFSMFDSNILRTGGFVLGKIVELFGKEGSGKTCLALKNIAQAQKMGLPCMFVDVERGFKERTGQRWAEMNGVDLSKLIYTDEIYTEHIMEAIWEALEHGVRVIWIDSLAAMVPHSDEKRWTAGKNNSISIEGRMPAANALILSATIPRIAALADDHRAVVGFINQLRASVNPFGRAQEHTPGGWTLKYHAWQRVQLRVVKKIEEDGKIVGVLVRAFVAKNKGGPPLQKTGDEVQDLPIYFDGRTADVFMELATILELSGDVKRAGPYFEWNVPPSLTAGDEPCVIRERGRARFLSAIRQKAADDAKFGEGIESFLSETMAALVTQQAKNQQPTALEVLQTVDGDDK